MSSEEIKAHEASRDPWPVFCFIAAVAGFVIPLGNILGPLVVWLLKKDENADVESIGREVINFQILFSAIGLILFILSSIPLIGWLIGWPIFVLWVVAGVLMMIVGAVKTYRGQFYRFPFNRDILGWISTKIS